jgi:hypothetical protein
MKILDCDVEITPSKSSPERLNFEKTGLQLSEETDPDSENDREIQRRTDLDSGHDTRREALT